MTSIIAILLYKNGDSERQNDWFQLYHLQIWTQDSVFAKKCQDNMFDLLDTWYMDGYLYK